MPASWHRCRDSSRKFKQSVLFLPRTQHHDRFAGQVACGELSCNIADRMVVDIRAALANQPPCFAVALCQSSGNQSVDQTQPLSGKLIAGQLLAWHISKDFTEVRVAEIFDLTSMQYVCRALRLRQPEPAATSNPKAAGTRSRQPHAGIYDEEDSCHRASKGKVFSILCFVFGSKHQTRNTTWFETSHSEQFDELAIANHNRFRELCSRLLRSGISHPKSARPPWHT